MEHQIVESPRLTRSQYEATLKMHESIKRACDEYKAKDGNGNLKAPQAQRAIDNLKAMYPEYQCAS